ncbi:substrate-binding periplasmic protein [Chitinimonas lacunae]|uniref:Substrate-binding periplasmic protein n=1 Tax=Chitinimonas lacunae TaxID=1963018 RepID=A0ABV8MTY3_9NEIS
MSLSLRLVLSLLTASVASADELPRRHLVCYNDLLAPYFMRGSTGYAGLNTDLVAQAAKRLGITVEFREMPWKRLEWEIRRGRDSLVECAFAFSRTPEREAYMEYTNVVMQRTEYVLFVRKDDPFATLSDFRGRVIGVRRGFRLPEAIQHGVAKHHFSIEEADDEQSNFRKLAARRLDAVLINLDVGLYVLAQMQETGIRPLLPPLSYLDNYLVFTRGKNLGNLIPAFDRELARMQQDGTQARLRSQYLGTPLPSSSDYRSSRSGRMRTLRQTEQGKKF